ncbi:MAG TPA: CBS domain-containing protein [Myxococcales bacterium]|nr:CBS domain-containing protein [Myxococcales bacterium]HIL00825.1 CBS domain-containing protein [Myxococcales bacterium]
MGDSHRVLTAGDIMATSLITLRPEMSIFNAIRILLSRGISGAPVVDDAGAMIGVLSELDCLRMLSSDEFYAGHQEEAGTVKHFMTGAGRTIPPDLGIYAIAHYFLTLPIRRLPVVEDGRLVGQVSRRDVLQGIETMAKQRAGISRQTDLIEIARSWSAL